MSSKEIHCGGCEGYCNGGVDDEDLAEYVRSLRTGERPCPGCAAPCPPAPTTDERLSNLRDCLAAFLRWRFGIPYTTGRDVKSEARTITIEGESHAYTITITEDH